FLLVRFFFSSSSRLLISAWAFSRFLAPSIWILLTSSIVEIRASLVCLMVSTSTMPRSVALAVSMVFCFRVSAFFFSRSLVSSVSFCWVFIAWSVWCMPRARIIWFFQSGMVVTMVVWIFSAMIEFDDWTILICGAIWIETILVRSRSWSFFSKRLAWAFRSFTFWASSGRFDLFAVASRAGSSFWYRSSSFLLPASMYMEISL